MLRYLYLLVIMVFIFIEGHTQQPLGLTMNKASAGAISINRKITASITLTPFEKGQNIDALSVSGSAKLNNNEGYIRIILIDASYNQYLVMDVYSLICDSENSLSFQDFCLETKSLQNIHPISLYIEVKNAVLNLNKINFTESSSFKSLSAVESSRNAVSASYVDLLNERIKEKGYLWVAAENSFSKLSYQEKAAMYGGELPNFQGFEYYAGGVFEYKKTSADAHLKSAGGEVVVPEFDWRNRQWQNWMTPVRDQKSCGSCWIFSAVGATEAFINLYYNRHLDLDLSEQQILSCNGHAKCEDGGNVTGALRIIINSGIVNESCFPYSASDLPCSNKCTSPSELIKIGGSLHVASQISSTEEGLKKALIKYGPLGSSVMSWGHAMTLVGFGTIKKGDVYFSENKELKIKIEEGDPRIGQTYWIFKNSYSESWGEHGYASVITPLDELYNTSALLSPVISSNYNDNYIQCTDNDGDGYYYWGIGTKPSTCQSCPDLPDGDDVDFMIGPMDENGNLDTLYSNCISSLSISNPLTGKIQKISAGDYINATNVISGGSKIYYGANKSVKLKTGFKVVAGNMFIGNLNGCSASSFKSEQELSKTENNIENAKPSDKNINSSITIYPNPANEIIYVEGVDIFDVSVINLSGMKVLQLKDVNGSFDISGLSTGIYSIHLISDGNSYIRKIVKQ